MGYKEDGDGFCNHHPETGGCSNCRDDDTFLIKEKTNMSINSNQRQQLIDYKNKLIDESKIAYDYASVEMEPINERSYLTESNVKEKIAKDIEAIIYGA